MLERIEGESISNPKRILSDLFKCEEDFENSISSILSQKEIKVQDIDSDIDSVWMVFDTETSVDTHKQLLWVKKQCEKIGWNLILTNPEFEFWLLMHVTDVAKYEDELIRSNEKVNSKRSFLSKELSNILPNGYRKSNIRPSRFIDRWKTYVNKIL